MEERWILRCLLVECKRNDEVMVDAKSATDDPGGLAVRLPRKPKPRLEIQILGFEERINVRISSLFRIVDTEQIRDLVVRFLRIRRHFPAQSHVQGEPRAHLVIVLHVKAEHGLPDAFVAFLADRYPAKE